MQGLSEPALFSTLLEGSSLSPRGAIQPGGLLSEVSEPAVVLLLAACAPPGTVVPPSLARGAVVCLNLRGSQHLFEALGRFTNLRWLDVSDKQLTHLPPWIATLPRLEGLVARGNRITSVSLPVGALKVVDLSSNQLTAVPDLPGLEALYLDNNPISTLPESFPCGRLSLVAAPLPAGAAPEGTEALERGDSPSLGELYISGDYLGHERPDPAVQRLRLACGRHQLTLRWDSGEVRWFSDESPMIARNVLLALLDSPDGARWEVAPFGPLRWSAEVGRAALVSLAGEALAHRPLVPLAQQLLSAARADLSSPLPAEVRHQWWAIAAGASARLWHALVADAKARALHVGEGSAEDPLLHGDTYAALWEQLDEGWGVLAMLFAPDPLAALREQIEPIAYMAEADAPYRVADVSSALVRGWGLPVR